MTSVFFLILFFAVIISLSSTSWLVCWMMMEISSFFFVPILFGLWSVSSMMLSFKYFLFQSIGSSVFLFSVIFSSISLGGWEWLESDLFMNVLTCFSMMMKLGVFPFHGWMIQVSEGLSLSKFFLLSSVQEVIPLVMISKFEKSESIFFFFIFFGMFLFVMFSFLKSSVHWMLMASSLFNVFWMVSASLLSKEVLLFFFLVYFSILYSFFVVLEEMVLVGSVFSMIRVSFFKGEKIVFIICSFMMMGIPPFGNFLGKVEVLWSMVMEGFFWLGFSFVFFSSIFMFLYFKMSLVFSLSMKGGKSMKEKDFFFLLLKVLVVCSFFFPFFFWLLYL